MADDETTDAPEGESTTGDTTDELGASGQKALVSERTARREAERTAKAAADQAAALQKQLDELMAGQMSDHEKALEAARKEAADAARAEVDQQYRSRLDAADVKAAASNFADPADAVLYLPADLPRDEDGSLNPKGLADALAEILESKPHLAATKPGPGSGDGGARGGSTAPTQLTQADLDAMKARGEHDAIQQAHAEGRLNALMGIPVG